MTGALWYAAADLLARQEDRKVLITLTDGIPNHFSSALDLVERASAAGIELIGIGIQTDVSALFPVAIRIDDIVDLKSELFRIAERLLLTPSH
jgi:cobalamin biosynthesis protein CobT